MFKKRRSKLGELLVTAGIITPDALKAGLALQRKEPDRNIGDIFIHMNVCDQEDINNILRIQKAMCNGGLHNIAKQTEEQTQRYHDIGSLAGDLAEKV